MRWIDSQNKVEELTYDFIDDITEELGLPVPFYPEVYWVGKRLMVGELGITKEEFKELRAIKKDFGRIRSTYLSESKIILINDYYRDVIAEEAGHFLHYEISRAKVGRENPLDNFTFGVISEMFGFFCSKLIVPTRPTGYRLFNDFPEKLDSRVVQRKILEIMDDNSDYDEDHMVHRVGYPLGEMLFYKYISGKISKKQIRNLFTDPLTLDGEPFAQFLNLKYNLLK